MSDRPVVLFPGLGAYSAGVLRQTRHSHEEVDRTFEEIDRTAALSGVPSVSAALFDGDPRPVRELLAEPAEVLQLAIFGVSLAVYRILTAQGMRPRLLVGHSFGEMAALVAAGAFTLADGVRLVCARTAALAPWEGRGGMAAIGTDEATAGHLVGVLGESDLVIGCLNAPRQTVVAGPLEDLDRAERVAAALDLLFARLHLPYASHHPSMRPAMADFVARTADIRRQPLRQAVYSPIHRRRYTDDDDLRQALAECLVRPVRFTETVRSLHAMGCTTFIESGALNALTKCVEQTVPAVRTFAPLTDPTQEETGLRAATLSASDGRSHPPGSEPRTSGDVVRPGGHAEAVPEAQVVGVAMPPARAGSAPDRSRVVAQLQQLYAQALEYPPELLTEDALLEAELGVDSLKQTALLAKVVGRFGLRVQAGDLRVWELPTLGRIADYVTATESTG
ncbi:acyl transferase domain-containing protein [Saccharothrix tamanrassetensis]|uniref:Acyl transferase domain-containing protein n=1 Tax=Saccharothrix tamanrassetensis TaxID=1051531 RepID=A0A841CM57_9PSEU|nr:acyltransferase domain-containing protein [Saccharothrix tamanrassetensis]MBB5957177.1 acyl transferase domain-containing protein [Saccharothrix tamanrassetensis]